MKNFFPIQFITLDCKIPEEIQVSHACNAGIRWIQLRKKNCHPQNYLVSAERIKIICDQYNATLVINDLPDIAVASKAHGVHLGKNDAAPSSVRKTYTKDLLIGASANTFERIQEVYSYVDYIGIGPFRHTSTKSNLDPILGIEGIRKIVEKCKQYGITIPLIAIGGITTIDVLPLKDCGVDGIAVSSAIACSTNIEKTAKEFLSLWKQKI